MSNTIKSSKQWYRSSTIRLKFILKYNRKRSHTLMWDNIDPSRSFSSLWLRFQRPLDYLSSVPVISSNSRENVNQCNSCDIWIGWMNLLFSVTQNFRSSNKWTYLWGREKKWLSTAYCRCTAEVRSGKTVFSQKESLSFSAFAEVSVYTTPTQ